jgi:hypothetical protein
MDTEDYIDRRRPNECEPAGSAQVVIDGVKEVADSPKEEEDRGMQERMYPVHKPHHMEIFKAPK